MGFFDDETLPTPAGDGRFTARLAPEWNIADNPNGGYLLSPVLRAMHSLVAGAGGAGHPDPLTVTTHFLRPGLGGADAEIEAELVKPGRLVSVLRGSLTQQGKLRLIMTATFGDLSTRTGPPGEFTVGPPELPPPTECVDRDGNVQGVDLAIRERVQWRLHPDYAGVGTLTSAQVSGWIRFADGSEPSALSLPFFADAFPPSIFATHGRVGWVPTLEMTVQVRARPAPGWLRALNRTDDIEGGRLVESGMIWDSEGKLVAQMRQLAMLLDH